MRHVSERPDDERTKPLTEPVLLILIGLSGGPRHGYALLQDIEELSGGRVRLGTGTLYGALRRLLEDRWIARHRQEDTSRDKQAYQITSSGRKQLHLELDRMKQLTKAAAKRMR